ncbi:hypothetical protein B0J14DRAFT_60599 [Halenospora varia]|nr:hypothetical protein B0J14DRAFT_60599 [Halenospora varia]
MAWFAMLYLVSHPQASTFSVTVQMAWFTNVIPRFTSMSCHKITQVMLCLYSHPSSGTTIGQIQKSDETSFCVFGIFLLFRCCDKREWGRMCELFIFC